MSIRASRALHPLNPPRTVDFVRGLSHRTSRISTLAGWGASAATFFALLFPLVKGFAQVATSIGPFSYQNQLYNPAPNPIPGLTGSPQPRGIAIFGGNVGAAGQAATPNDGVYYAVQSGFGQPTAEPRQPDVLIGQEIVPDLSLGADLSKTPDIVPPVKAFYVADVQKVFANESGLVQVTWKKSD